MHKGKISGSVRLDISHEIFLRHFIMDSLVSTYYFLGHTENNRAYYFALLVLFKFVLWATAGHLPTSLVNDSIKQFL